MEGCGVLVLRHNGMVFYYCCAISEGHIIRLPLYRQTAAHRGRTVFLYVHIYIVRAPVIQLTLDTLPSCSKCFEKPDLSAARPLNLTD